MDTFTEEHFQRWLEYAVDPTDQDKVEQGIRAILAEYPDLIDKGRSWPELRQLYERNALWAG